MSPPTTDGPTLILATLVATIAVARATRLLIHDTFPPVLWARLRWLTWTAQTPRRTPWARLADCPWCLAPWLAALDTAWALVAGLDSDTLGGLTWWTINTWATIAYLAPMLVVRDEPPAE